MKRKEEYVFRMSKILYELNQEPQAWYFELDKNSIVAWIQKSTQYIKNMKLNHV